ncbi:hypothetical protein AK812_SmicGene9649 [Symbiodinium microadriaticum]|uniref:Uncharacterized protein n=1 Tax=Symbiodinium microadriaticum TaxID=2951 RepID=A0A1Q9EHY7_SYMMI|nr:hypothetical protein AK812_SmicGene9649 [Symbiodinium microadriaticum]
MRLGGMKFPLEDQVLERQSTRTAKQQAGVLSFEVPAHSRTLFINDSRVCIDGSPGGHPSDARPRGGPHIDTT